MITQPPKAIHFLSDDTTAELVVLPAKLQAKLDAGVYMFRFTQAEEKLGLEFPFSLSQIKNLESVKLLKIIL